jgi:hypothetical protein
MSTDKGSARCKACNGQFEAKRYEDHTFEEMCKRCISYSESDCSGDSEDAEFIFGFMADKIQSLGGMNSDY